MSLDEGASQLVTEVNDGESSLTMDLARTESGDYEGMTIRQSLSTGHLSSPGTLGLAIEGGLDPRALLKRDPVLFAIVYVLLAGLSSTGVFS